MKEETVTCPVCNGTKQSKYTGNSCGCCNATGVISKKAFDIKQSIGKDILKRLSNK